MKLPLQFQIRFMRCFWGVKPRFAGNNAVSHYLCAPFTLMGANTKQTNFVLFCGFSHILQIAKPRYLAQIAKPIVEFVSVYVVDMFHRPFSGHIRPRQSMRELLAVVDGYRPIARRMFGPRTFTDKIRSLFMQKPCKGSCGGVIDERRPQMFDGAWWFDCHDKRLTIGEVQ